MRGRVRARQRRVKALTRCQKVKLRREREIWNPYIVFLVKEENKNFCKKNEKSAIISLVWRREGEILQIFSSFEKRNLKRFSPVSSGERLFSHRSIPKLQNIMP